MRPTVAGLISPTHRLSNFVDLILKPLCQHVPSFIRDMQYGFSEQNTYKYNRENDIGIIRRLQLVYKYPTWSWTHRNRTLVGQTP